MNKNIKIEATGDFQFEFFIEKAIPGGTETEMEITGVASTVNIDHDNERMSLDALKSMAEVINEKSVPLRIEHQKDNNAICGKVHNAWVDERNQLWIKAILDNGHPASSILYKTLKDGVKLGLSVGGRVKKAVKEMSEATGKMVKTFYQVVLDEVSVTQRPANYDSWLIAKSIIDKNENTESLYNSGFYNDFLFENNCLDYMQSFAKSIPNKAWKKIDINNLETNKNMEKKVKKEEEETETKEKAEETTETKEKKESIDTETEEEAESFKAMVVKGFESLTNMIAKLSKSSTEKEEETTIMEEKTKAEETETETKEKAEDTENTEYGTKKANDEETETETKSGKDYQMKSMKSLLKRMEDISKKVDSEDESEKDANKDMEDSTDKDEEETTKSASIDQFVEALTKSVDALEEKMAKNGKRSLGFAQNIAEIVKNDPEVQKSIKEMLGEKGFKKSVSMGIPYMRTKTGQIFELTAKPINDTVEKSRKDNAGKSFKELYKQEFSSVAQASE